MESMDLNELENITTDENSEYRKLSGKAGFFCLIFCVFVSLFHLWYNSFGLIDVMIKNTIHVISMMGIVFLICPATSKSPKDSPSLVDWILFCLTIGAGIYFTFSYVRLIESMLQPITSDLIFGVTVILLIIEASRRTVGIPLTLLSVLFLVYTYVGPYMPGVFQHQGFSLKRILVRMTMTSEGIFGIAIMVSASYVFMFILFASFLKATKASEFFNDLAAALTGTARGGPAKMAIFASALTGTISGSSQANVATTGTFTIPLMKSIGYKPYFAGAVEAIASTGGILTPPVMGAAAFIMSSYLGIPYTTILLAAITPAFLYYFSLYQMIDLGAAKWGLVGVPKDQLPSTKKVLLERGQMLIPLILIIVFLLIGFSPLLAAFIGIVSVLVASSFRKDTRMSLKDIIFALDEGARTAAPIAVICGIIGFIIGAVGMTGIGQVIGHHIVALAGGRLWLTAVLCMFTAIILGMGLPASACYIVTATIAAPSLIILGVPELAAHFFAFYYGTLSAVVPPVALTSFTAAAIANANPTKVAVNGLLLGAAGLLLPFMFIFNPQLLLINFTWGTYLISFSCALVGLFSLAVAVMGMLKSPLAIPERCAFVLASLSLISPFTSLRVVGFSVFGVVMFFHFLRSKKRAHKEVVAEQREF